MNRGLPRCRVCERLIWPWQDVTLIVISADGTEPPVNFFETFHKVCIGKVHARITERGGVVRDARA